MLSIVLLFFISLSLQAMEFHEKDKLLKHQVSSTQDQRETPQSPFQGMPREVSYQILGFLVEADNGAEGFCGFLSLARTCKADNQLYKDFCQLEGNREKIKQLKFNFLHAKVDSNNVVQLLKIAHELRKEDEVKQCTDFMAQGIEPDCKDGLSDFFCLPVICCGYINFEDYFKRHISKKYNIPTELLSDVSKNKYFSFYRSKRYQTQECVYCWLFCCPFAFLLGCNEALEAIDCYRQPFCECCPDVD